MYLCMGVRCVYVSRCMYVRGVVMMGVMVRWITDRNHGEDLDVLEQSDATHGECWVTRTC